jgi:L-lactate dehydrogenase (cytochrome)
VGVKRQLPRAHDLRPLLQLRKPELNAKRRRLEKALTIEDLRRVARRRTPKAAFDYTDGAADGEVSLARAREAFGDVEFVPSILRDVSTVDTSREVLGSRVTLPFGIAPTGFTRMMQTEGEIAGAQAAAAAGIPFSLSTMGTTSIEDVAAATAATSGSRNWFQLYMWKDRDRSMALVERAAKAGFDTLLVTVDVPVAGARLRDVRNGMTIPPRLSLRTVANAVPRPAWWFDFLTTEPLAFASLDSWSGTVAELLDTMFDPTVTYEDLAWIREQWPGRVSVKGVQSVADARRLADAGVDAIILSNHGGRQLDRAPVPFHLLPSVVKEVGSELEVHLDTGIMSGQDIVAAVAHGARFTLIGRAYLYGLMAGGRDGVDRTIEILQGQIERTMRLLGVSTLDELEPGHVRVLQRLVPRD